MKKGKRLTKEQNELRLAGLRILARLIVRAHLNSLIEEARQAAPAEGSDPRTEEWTWQVSDG